MSGVGDMTEWLLARLDEAAGRVRRRIREDLKRPVPRRCLAATVVALGIDAVVIGAVNAGMIDRQTGVVVIVCAWYVFQQTVARP